MKTIEEKAKAYDEAKELAKKIYNESAGSCCDIANATVKVLEGLFPQLKESEDEKIRKKLIGIFTNQSICDVYNLKSEDVLAYLEKQKEQKPTSFNEPYNPDEYEVVMEGNATSLKRKEQKPADISSLRNWKRIIDEVLTEHEGIGQYLDNPETERIAKKLQKQFSLPQNKPVEWSEEDEKMLHIIITDINYAQKNFSDSKLVPYDKKVNWLKALRLQPKKERQIKEGDKVSIHCRKDRKEDIIAIYDGKVGEVIGVWDAERNPWGHIVVMLDNGFNNGFYEDELEVLDEPKWKPSEQKEQKINKWSKKDKKILLSLHHVMNCADAQNAVKRDGLSVEDVCDFLFSIEPNSKLSEDQIYTLERICSNLHLRSSDDAPKLDEIIKLLKQK